MKKKHYLQHQMDYRKKMRERGSCGIMQHDAILTKMLQQHASVSVQTKAVPAVALH